ncbi:hypothetical protein NL676_000298 [Syzygium grande]|nr:hypothetical protein NL676_000298 [Syzygium grande]
MRKIAYSSSTCRHRRFNDTLGIFGSEDRTSQSCTNSTTLLPRRRRPRRRTSDPVFPVSIFALLEYLKRNGGQRH